MAFRFSMESVLKHRKRQEEFAHRDVVEAQIQLEECLHGIENMYRQIDETRLSISRSEQTGSGNDLQWVLSFETFIDAQKVRIQKERLRARELIRDLENKQEVLLERLHDRKIIEKLKERRQQEYLERLARLEQKELDDLNNSRSRWLVKGCAL
jgi:flagellar FliJ protein